MYKQENTASNVRSEHSFKPPLLQSTYVHLFAKNDSADNSMRIDADRYDFFAVIMSFIISDYTIFDDTCIFFDEWERFLSLCESYLSCQSYAELLDLTDSSGNIMLKYWIRMNGYCFWDCIDDYRLILSGLRTWTQESVRKECVTINGI
ncbi:MAG: hypothetical protein IJ366_09980 [Clostridia bacterium]|nr:hypothetical protein [Clostridia bacterium]